MAANSNFNRILRGAILRRLRAQNVYDGFVSRDLVRGQFEEVEDTVQIQTLGNISVSDYSGTLPTAQDLQTDETSISADHKKAFAFKAPRTDSASEIADQFQEEGVASLLQEAQGFVLGQYTDASLQVTYDPANDSIRDKIAEIGTKLDNAGAPDGPSNRWLTVPPEVSNDIDDEVIDSVDTGLAEDLLRSGLVGTFKGFRIYKTAAGEFTNTGSSPEYLHAMAGINQSIAYADAVLSVRRIPSTDFVGDQVDGLHVAGSTVVRDGATVDFRVKQ